MFGGSKRGVSKPSQEMALPTQGEKRQVGGRTVSEVQQGPVLPEQSERGKEGKKMRPNHQQRWFLSSLGCHGLGLQLNADERPRSVLRGGVTASGARFEKLNPAAL